MTMTNFETDPRAFLRDLRKKTGDAVQRGEQKRKAAEEAAELQKKRIQERDQRIAENIIADIPLKCEEAAEKCQSQAVIMEMQYDRDYTYPTQFGGTPVDLPIECLRGPALIVWNRVKGALSIKIESWHDGMGEKSGYNLVVNW